MNKELIKKYKAEFDHWLNGGAIQAFYKQDDEPKWWTDDDSIYYDNFSHIISKSLGLDDVIIVIDDEYIEFRKALVEGKTIQIAGLNPVAHPTIYKNSYVDMEGDLFDKAIELYRIKSEEPKFKECDWVIHNGEYKKVTKVIDGCIDSLDNQPAVISKFDVLELWKPKNNEYFWYKNDLVKFDETQTNAGLLLQSVRGCSYYGCSYYPSENFEDFCEPFIGNLPSNLK